MKFVVSSSALLNHLLAISRVINSKSTLPILDSFLFQLKENELHITASDIETTLVTTMETVSSEGEGLFAISAKMLLDPLKEFPEQPIEFKISNTMEITILSENGKYTLIGQNGNEYPQINTFNSETIKFSIQNNELQTCINRTLFATADDELRPVMNGIFFDLTGEQTNLVASNGHKLVKYSTNAMPSLQSSFILPKKPAMLLKNILPKEDGEVQVEFDSKNAVFTLSNYKMICRLIEGTYPNYNAVIPVNNPNKVIIDRLTFTTALKRVSAFSNQAINLVALEFKENNLIISTQDIDFSTSAKENIICQYQGAPLKIGFNSLLLIEILNNIPSSDVILELADKSRAGVILPSEKEDDAELLMLLMPMMLND